MSKTTSRIDSLKPEHKELVHSFVLPQDTMGDNLVHRVCLSCERSGLKIGKEPVRRLLAEHFAGHQNGNGNGQGQKIKPIYKRWNAASCVH